MTQLSNNNYISINISPFLYPQEIIAGKDVSTIPLGLETPGRTAFDWNQLKKWHIDSLQLPDDSVFFNQPEDFFVRYRYFLPIGILILFAMLLLVLFAYIGSTLARLSTEELKKSYKNLEESQELLLYQTEYDEVLDILNRRTITEYIQKDLTPEDIFSVVVVDIDGFKALNENYGHQVADSILQYLVAILKEIAINEGKNGEWKIARYGGDEFLMLIPNIRLTTDHEVVRKILNGIHAPIPLGQERLAITASIGISNSDGSSRPELQIINAESAMYEAKDHGRNMAVLFNDEMKEKVRSENAIKQKVEKALDNNGFYMVYQPKVNSKTKKVNGYEALVRMKEPGIYPGQFIPIAERSGWIWRIGRITTELTIKQLAEWRDAGYELHPISVNYSSNQLNDHGYLDFVEALLQKYDIPAHFLEIEITEGLFLEKSALAEELFKRFKEMGIKLLMDDFGTGYSSLGYLTYIPVDIIKLDKSLVDTYLVDGKDSFIKNLIHLMHDLGKKMIIEGVEEEWQYERLKKFGADTIQGYYFSKPLPPEEAIEFKVKLG